MISNFRAYASQRLRAREKNKLVGENTPDRVAKNKQKKNLMNDQEKETKELALETSKTRKRKILTDPERIWTKCHTCKEAGNLENMIRHGLEVKDSRGVVLYGAFRYVYLCSENCKGLFGLNSISG